MFFDSGAQNLISRFRFGLFDVLERPLYPGSGCTTSCPDHPSGAAGRRQRRLIIACVRVYCVAWCVRGVAPLRLDDLAKPTSS
eukprot:6212360-Pleurochrysis_carterae.AAC.3